MKFSGSLVNNSDTDNAVSFFVVLNYIFLSTARRKEGRFTLLKQEGNDLVKKSQFQAALEKYSECLSLKPEEYAVYTNRFAWNNLSMNTQNSDI